MPRVVPNQRAKFQTDPLFKQLQVNSEIKYTNYWDRSMEERRQRFRVDCYEGNCKIGFVSNGIHCVLSFPKAPGSRYTTTEFVDFEREKGKAHLSCQLIFNGVSVKFHGCLDVEKLIGFGHLEFDEELAQIEDHLMKETLGKKRLKEGEAYPSDRNSCIYETHRE